MCSLAPSSARAKAHLCYTLWHCGHLRPPRFKLVLLYRLLTRKLSRDDWTCMLTEATMLKKQRKVCYYQPYNPHATNDSEKPFILIIQDQWMLEMAMRFSWHNSWVIDSTFKTNAFGLPLYAVVLPNQHGVGIPIWFMMCSNDPGLDHERIALEITLSTILSRMGNFRSTALVIDKSSLELEAFSKVINGDECCWHSYETGPREQRFCHIIVCWFHTKKAWVENLLPKVPKELQDHFYSSMTTLMHAFDEVEFENHYQELLQHYAAHINVQRYVTNGWCGCDCPWRRRWSKFGRLLNYGNVDTTNLVERLWQYIKYILLDARINRSIVDLLHAMVGDSTTGTRMGGTLLEFFKQKQEIVDSGRYNIRGSSKQHTTRLHGGEKILQLYEDLQNTKDINEYFMDNSIEDGADDNEVLKCVSEVRSILTRIEEGLKDNDPAQKAVLLRELNICKDTLLKTSPPKAIEMPMRGSIRQIQAHVTQTKLGNGKRPQEVEPNIEVYEAGTSQPTKRAHVTGILRRKHQRGIFVVLTPNQPLVHP
ncbi:hypothetical protein GOP47_0016669 [Adiantum capillus-veneris]|uniref:MULE transposase domain-containing protein n=1 Tax=Adiantum capillus-veneris TaxID=13818 RepID=A0A9D4UIX0_ADICA|nr:hypothetical protein GOP47_0016669 [Adiantum capillus-veneris]